MLRLIQINIETLAQDGTVISSQLTTGGGEAQPTDNIISERKRLTAQFMVEADEEYGEVPLLDEAYLYINFALFLPVGVIYNEPSGPPNTGFSIKLPIITGDEVLEMPFYSNGSPNPEPNRNFRCYFLGEGADTFSIRFEYYNTYDEGTYANNLVKNTNWRFLSEFWNEENFNVIPKSVYNVQKEMRCMIYLNSNVVIKKEFILTKQQNDSFNAPSEWQFGADNIISSFEDTEVVALIQTTDDITDFYVKIFKDKNDGSSDFITTIDLKENKIQTGSPDNIIKGPFTVDTVIGGDGNPAYQLGFFIDHTLVEKGVNYRLIALGYNDYSSNKVAAVSQLVGVTLYAPYDGDGLNFTGSLSDIQREFFGDELTCVIEERIRTKMYVDFPYDSWKNSVDNRLGITTALNDIREYLRFVKIDIYEEYFDTNLSQTVVNLLQTSLLSRTGTNTYYSQDMVATFNADSAEFELTFRNKNDASSPPISVTANGVPYYNPYYSTGNQYWGGRDLKIKWRFGFDYGTFQDLIDYTQQLHVKDYDEGISIGRIGSDKYYVCQGEELYYNAQVTSSIPDYDSEQWLLINTVESFGLLALLEEERFPIGVELPTQSNNYIISQDITYGRTGVKAEFCIDPTLLITPQQYKFSAMAKKDYTY